MDLFKRKAKEVTAGQGQAGPPGDGHKGDTRVHATIGAMERGAVEHMMKIGIPPGFSERQTPTRGTRTHKAENLPSVSSALKRGGDAGLFSAPPTAILSAPLTSMPLQDWNIKKSSKPGSQLRVIWKKNKATRANFAWWDSEDGLHGGKMLRCSMLESDRCAIKDFDLFPTNDASKMIISIVTSTDQTLELPYVTYSFLSADEIGPPGMMFVAPQGMRYPVDALWIKPSLEKQLERKQVEQQSADDQKALARNAEMLREVKESVARREKMERKHKCENKLRGLIEWGRQPQISDSETHRISKDDEFATWTQLDPAGLPPPPQKHAICILYEFQVEKDTGFRKKNPSGADANKEEDDDVGDIALSGLVLTLEVWSHNFTERYNIYISAKNTINFTDMRCEMLGLPTLTWIRTCVFDPHIAPDARDSPALCYDGKCGLFFFGGKTKGGDYKTFFNDLWRFDYKKNRWHMYSDGTKVLDHGRWKMMGGLSGKKPTCRSSNTMVLLREAERGNEEDFLYVAGGADRQGKCVDVRRIVVEQKSPDYLRWNELIGGQKSIHTEGDIKVHGRMPQRGFCCKGLCTKTSVFAPQFHDQEILQLDLHDHNVMTKFICADFNGQSENGYPGIEVAEAWNVYNSADVNDNREGALMQWLLCPGQIMKFRSIPSVGDKPGTLSAHAVTKSVVMLRGQKSISRFWCFGGTRQGGKALLSPLPADYRVPQIVGRNQTPRIGMRVKANAAFWQRIREQKMKDKVTPGSISNQDLIRQYGIGTGSSQKTKESLKEDEDLLNMDPDQLGPDQLGVITEVIDEIQDVDEDGRIITEKTEDIEVMVRFDGHQADLLCFAGQDGIFDLVEYVNYDLYQSSGGMITNELWTLDVKESDHLVTMMKRFFDLVRVSGHTDEFSLMQILGKRIRIDDKRKSARIV